ncbi:MAG: PKD-like domain [Bacteroidota bacterium]|jgi:hypothetical protein
MKQLIILALLLWCVSASAQQTLCLNDTQAKRYWVDKTEGSTYQWAISGGKGNVISGNGTNEISVMWASGNIQCELLVIETNNNGCVGEASRIKVIFSGPTASLDGNNLAVCGSATVRPTYKVTFDGTAPWSFRYELNGTVSDVIQTTANPYDLTLASITQSGTYKLKLSSVSDKNCIGAVSATEKLITVYPKVLTSAIKFE